MPVHLLACPLGLLFLLPFLFSSSVVAQPDLPIDGLFAESELEDRRLLPYPSVRQGDISYMKRQTRTLDTRELLNLPFRHPDWGFFKLLMDGVDSGQLTIYDALYPDFSRPLNGQEWIDQLNTTETIGVIDPETGQWSQIEVNNLFDIDQVVRFRIREVVYFDHQTSSQQTRIIGIAPLQEQRDELGNVQYELLLGWIYWPHARSYFQRQRYYLDGTDQAVLSWTDALDMRRFSSYISTQSNVRGSRLQDHHQGRALLLRSRMLKAELENREHDMWSY